MADKKTAMKYIPLSREEREELKQRISMTILWSKQWHFSQA
jgi:hypothetical protein